MNKFSPHQFQIYAEGHDHFLNKENSESYSNGVWTRYVNPVLTKDHTPIFWRYDINPKTNPFGLERLGINAVFNPGALALNGKIYLVARVEGYDRKSFFAIAESPSGIDKFRFWDYPIQIPENDNPDVNIYDMRLTQHEDGWIYGLFCTERRDPKAKGSDQTSAIAKCGIVRTRDLNDWQRLPDLITASPQQRNVVLHPEYIDGHYGLYTRPQDGFIEAGSGGGIAWGITPTMDNARIEKEVIIDQKIYHTIKETKNGQGPPPIKTSEGWIHLAHGVRNTAAGLRYVLYMFMTDLQKPWKVIYAPGGYFMAPEEDERIGDVSNVLFSNGWVEKNAGEVLIYYASSDTRIHVASTRTEILLDYLKNTPPDALRSSQSVAQRMELIERNLRYLSK